MGERRKREIVRQGSGKWGGRRENMDGSLCTHAANLYRVDITVFLFPCLQSNNGGSIAKSATPA